VRRVSRWDRSPGWIRSGIGTAVLVGGFFVTAAPAVGFVLAHVSDAVGVVFGGVR
jgi:hypothetical protein